MFFKKKEKSAAGQADVQRQKVFESVQNVIAEHLDVNPGSIRENTSLAGDLRLSDLDLFEITMALEEEFEIDIPPERAKWATVKDIMDTLQEYDIA